MDGRTPAETAVPARPSADRTFLGIALMLAATTLFSLSNVAAKSISETLPGLQIAWMVHLVFCVTVLPAILVRRGTAAFRTARPGLHLLRALAANLSGMLVILGLAHLPVAESTAINFASPLFITALSIPLLGEVVGKHRWAATIAGFLGVVIVARPGTDAFQLAALLPLSSALAWSVAVVSTRRMDGERTDTMLAWYAAVGFVLLTAALPFSWQAPSASEVGYATLSGAFAAAGSCIIVLAYQKAQASVLAPFSYSQILSAGILGYIAFGTVPGAWTFVGGAVIAASGLYVAYRERLTSGGHP